MSPEEFIGELCSSCRVAQIAVGEDWHFGRGRAGNVENPAPAVLPLRVPGDGRSFYSAGRGAHKQYPDSRSRARGGFFTGCRHAWPFLPLEGPGDSRAPTGAPAGLPHGQYKTRLRVTASPWLYAVRARVAGKKYGGVANLGVRPTVEGETGELLLEAHLFGHPGNIYGREMEVEPVRFLRPEINPLFGRIEKASLPGMPLMPRKRWRRGSKTQKTVKWRMTA